MQLPLNDRTYRQRRAVPGAGLHVSLDEPEPPFGTSWRAAKMVVQGARERMFCHVTPIRTPCSRLLACRPADLICRNEYVTWRAYLCHNWHN